MEAVILAAGEGKRTHPLTKTRPKVMLTIANKPILEWNLINTIKAGIKKYIFIIGYKKEKIIEYFQNGEKWNITIKYKIQKNLNGTAKAIKLVEKECKDFIIISGDTIFNTSDIKNIIKNKNSIGLATVKKPENYGIVETKGEQIIKIHEKMKKPFTNKINAGIYHLDKKIFNSINKTKKSKRGEYEITDSLNIYAKNEKIKGIELKEFMDIVYPWNLLDINKKILEKIKSKKLNNKLKGLVTEGWVKIGKNCKILPGTFIEGPVIIGDNCKIGPNCYIRPHTSIGNNCHIGNASEIKNSIIMNNSNAPHQNYVGDSIIGENCNLGAGTKIANLRFDKKNIEVKFNSKIIQTNRRKLGAIIGDNVQTGINSNINIGTIIENNICYWKN